MNPITTRTITEVLAELAEHDYPEYQAALIREALAALGLNEKGLAIRFADAWTEREGLDTQARENLWAYACLSQTGCAIGVSVELPGGINIANFFEDKHDDVIRERGIEEHIASTRRVAQYLRGMGVDLDTVDQEIDRALDGGFGRWAEDQAVEAVKKVIAADLAATTDAELAELMGPQATEADAAEMRQLLEDRELSAHHASEEVFSELLADTRIAAQKMRDSFDRDDRYVALTADYISCYGSKARAIEALLYPGRSESFVAVRDGDTVWTWSAEKGEPEWETLSDFTS